MTKNTAKNDEIGLAETPAPRTVTASALEATDIPKKTTGRATRTAEVRENRPFDPAAYGLRTDLTRAGQTEVDQFHVPKHLIPPGWTVQWMNETIMGQPERPEVVINHMENGWQYANSAMFREMLPPGYADERIRRGGQVLMIRQAHLTAEAEAEQRRLARQQMQAKEAELGYAPPGQFERTDPRVAPRVTKHYEPMEIPSDPEA